MRTALIIASFALTVIAAPVPVAEDQAPSVQTFTPDSSPIDVTIEKRFRRTGDGTLVGSQLDARGFRPSGKREEVDAELEERALRNNKRALRNNRREEDDETELEERALRNNKRALRNNKREEDDEAELEERALRNNKRALRNNKRALRNNRREEDDEETELEERALRNNKRALRNNKREEDEDEVELEERALRNNKRALRNNRREEASVEKRASVARGLFNGVGAFVEALKTRGFTSANHLAAREPM